MRYLTIFIISSIVTLGGLLAYQKFLLPQKVKKVYVVDTDKIIALEQKEIFRLLQQGKQANMQAIEIDKKFQRAIDYIAKKDNAVVYAKKAIVSNYDKDITQEVLILVGGMR